jgi:pyruvate kinase
MRRTKIVCTIGPASDSVGILQEMMAAGMNVARLNFSHGSYEEHGERINKIKEAAKLGCFNIPLILDTKGPEIRTGEIEGKISLLEGQSITVTTKQVMGNKDMISISYEGLPKDVKKGNTILIDDGIIGLRVEGVNGDEIKCTVLNGGELSSKKGVNVPGVKVNLPAITDKDVKDIEFGIQHKLDFIAASFVRCASDVLDIREILERESSNIHIISKIECRAAVENIDEIIQVSDGIMVARGDLGVEIPTEEVPLVQKQIIKKCNKAGKPVITATQMLDSMMRNPRPTRAEANDVANAIFDGTDAVMLSGESAAGKYPLEAVMMMAKIAERTEAEVISSVQAKGYSNVIEKTVTDSIGNATANLALDLNASAIITPTSSGSTARMVAKYRPKAPIIAATANEETMRKLALIWGVDVIDLQETSNIDDYINTAVHNALNHGKINLGDLVIVTAGMPQGTPGTTNLLKVHIVGEAVVKGTGIGKKVACGKVQICRSAKEALARINEGDILVTNSTDRDYVAAMKKAAAIITEVGGLTSHAAIVSLSLGIPVIVGAKGALRLLEDSLIITVDSKRGYVYKV